MIMDLEDVIALLEEMLSNKTIVALTPNESVHKQYANLGVVEGIKLAVKRLETINGREKY